jgi:hypothetical protein
MFLHFLHHLHFFHVRHFIHSLPSRENRNTNGKTGGPTKRRKRMPDDRKTFGQEGSKNKTTEEITRGTLQLNI